MSPETRTQLIQWAWAYGALPLLWFSVVLHLRTPWWRTALGTHLLVYTGLLASILTFASLRYFTGDDDFPVAVEWIRWVLYMSFPPVIAWRVWLQIQAARSRD